MSAHDYDPNWWHRIEEFNRGLAVTNSGFIINRAESGTILNEDSFYLRSDEPKPDPRNYRGADWSEVG